ncbi:MAG TPA: hypothetical protein VM345_17340 [Acidimicrobiales bacterium]|nr:hypothetical protein [Acidimicrobiales bacterium]
MALTFKDRVLTPKVARAMFSPSAIVAAGAGTAAGVLLAGLGPAAVVLGAVAWAGRVLLAVPRGAPSAERIDAFRVGEPWRRFVLDAQQAQRRFTETVRRSRSGPVQERLRSIGAKIDEAVSECWQIARQGDQLDAALRTLDVRRIRLELEDVYEERRRQAHDEEADDRLYRAQLAIESQLESAERLQNVAVDAQNRLRLLNAQLDEAVARSVEISLTAGDVSQLGGLTDDVDHVVEELEALRQGLEEASGVARGTRGTSAPGTA